MSDAKKVLVIINPRSGKYTVKSQLYSIADMFTKSGYVSTIFTTQKRGDATEYAQLLADKYDIIVCRGGDGTLNEVINGVMNSGVRCPIGYIPAGTSNDFAASIGVQPDAKMAIDVISSNEPHAHDIGRLEGAERYFTYTASFGLFTKASYSTSQVKKNLFGYAAYLSEGIKEVKDMTSFKMKVTCDGEDYSGDYVFGAVTNARAVGGIMHYKKETVDFNDGKFEVLLVKRPPTLKELVRLVRTAHNGEIDNKYMTFCQCSEVVCEYEDGELPWTIDGEFGGTHKTATIHCVHSAIDIYRGN